jgi:hypothetical protein
MIASASAVRLSNIVLKNKINSGFTNKGSLMKHPTTKLAAASQTPVFPQTMHETRPNHDKPIPQPKPKKRDNIFSKSRDLREDRGTREMKTSHNDQTFHAR